MFLYKNKVELCNITNIKDITHIFFTKKSESNKIIETIESKMKKIIIETMVMCKKFTFSYMEEDYIEEALRNIGINIYKDIRINWATDGRYIISFYSKKWNNITIYKNELNIK